jgi:DNA gyrase/topoisomerase IV subunit B
MVPRSRWWQQRAGSLSSDRRGRVAQGEKPAEASRRKHSFTRPERTATTSCMAQSEESIISVMRKRPGMYIGDTRDGSGLHHMLWEVVANALDQHLKGHATKIDVTLNEDGSITVEDDGEGFPIHLVQGVPFAEIAMTTFHETGTLDGHVPHAHVGLHGLGVSIVNALSSRLVLEGLRGFLHEPKDAFVCQGLAEDVRVDAAMQWAHRGYLPNVRSFANNEETERHGTHLDGLLQGIADAVFPEMPARTRSTKRVRDALSSGLQAIIHVTLANPTLSGSTRDQLTSSEAMRAVRAVVGTELARQLDERPAIREELRRRLTGEVEGS